MVLGGDAIKVPKNTVAPKRPAGRTSPQNRSLERPLKIGEAAKLVGVEAYVLRFWETQFQCIRPKQSRSRHRFYSQGDIETLKYIKRLLHTEGYTIAGARKFIREKGLIGTKNLPTPVSRSAPGLRTKERSHSAAVMSGPDGGHGVVHNGVHRALRKIREDLRALHKLLEAH